jgi:hypothetical protein
MKKTLLKALLVCLAAMPVMAVAQSTVQDGQSTEGKDFWVTFMQADQDNNNSLDLSLSISSRKACTVTISNPYTNYSETVQVNANEMKLVELYSGSVLSGDARYEMESTGKVCYAVNSEQVDTCALHVTATENISLFATSYKRATFDATNVLPTASLLDEYVIQTYTPSDHGGVNSTQGSHFAIIAAEDDVVVDITPTVPTDNGKPAGQTFATEKLKKGQVYYVWTGMKDDEIGDLSGTYVKARDEKKIAVFQGNPHTNIPYQVKQRDHLFSQAMPVKYWGNTFVLTASAGRVADKIRILALNDGTEVRIGGNLVYTFDFNTNPKHFWEFDLGPQGDYGKDGSCLVNTSCPCAVHLFLASQQYIDKNNKNGDPAMLWVNPIEQQIDQVTFATYSSKNGTTSHYVNVVTDKPENMFLDGGSIQSDFKQVSGSNTYHYAQISLGSTAASHTLKSTQGNFIAHVYGFTSNESYGYSAGGATKPLTQYITINGQIFTPDSENTLCGEDTIKFACHPDYEWNKIVWNFGDGQTLTVTEEKDSVVLHYYPDSKTYNAYVLIYRESSNLCAGQNAVDSIPITVTIGRYEFTIGDAEVPCPEDGKSYICKIPYTNEGNVDLHGDNVKIEFDQAAKDDGFDNTMLVVGEEYFIIYVSDKAVPDKRYGIHLVISSDCGGADTTMYFSLPIDNVLIQRYDNVIGLANDQAFSGKTLSDFQWYRVSGNDTTQLEGQNEANLNFYDLPYGGDMNAVYYVCYTVNKGTGSEVRTCACGIAFEKNEKGQQFGDMQLTASYVVTNGEVFVNADYKGEKDIECYAQWINASGQVYQDLKFDIPDGGCTIPTPAEKGLYLLRVQTGKGCRSFKFVINQ